MLYVVEANKTLVSQVESLEQKLGIQLPIKGVIQHSALVSSESINRLFKATHVNVSDYILKLKGDQESCLDEVMALRNAIREHINNSTLTASGTLVKRLIANNPDFVALVNVDDELEKTRKVINTKQ